MARPAGAPPPRVTTDLRSCRQTTLHFHCAFEIRQSQSLAHMLDSLVRVSRRAAHNNAKAEPKIALRNLRRPSPSRSPSTALHRRPGRPWPPNRGCTVHGARDARREDERAPDTALQITVGNKTGQRSPDLSMPTKGNRSAHRQTHRPAAGAGSSNPAPNEPADRQCTDAYLADDTRRTCA